MPENHSKSESKNIAQRTKLERFIKRLIVVNRWLIGIFFLFLLCAFISPDNLRHIAITGLYTALKCLGLGIPLQLLLGFIVLYKSETRPTGFAAIKNTIYSLLLLAPPTAFIVLAGASWGRPLRIKGRQIHPELCEGSDWTRGPTPDPSGLDKATHQALEALWLHDAQKEHASVPAFSRISWMLAAVGAPAELLEWSHKAALEEIEHTRLCFALAAGYAGRSHSVEAMPDLLLGGLDLKDDPMAVLAQESLKDGCQLEDFNADVAAACAKGCEEPATRSVLEQIAREERSHAEFSWAVLEWTLQRAPHKVLPAIDKSLTKLDKVRRPTAVSCDKQHFVDKANPDLMIKHGRLPDAVWGDIWNMRLAETKKRLQILLAAHASNTASSQPKPIKIV